MDEQDKKTVKIYNFTVFLPGDVLYYSKRRGDDGI